MWILIILFLAVIILDSALKKDDNYYPQVFLKECKYIEEKVIREINGNLSDFFVLMRLMKSKLEWIKFFISQLPLNLITTRGLLVI